jgi:hypothetical protein
MKKIIQYFALLIIVTTLIFTAQVSAQLEGNPDNFCRNGAFPRESKDFRLARINGKKGERIYFYGDEREDCPAAKDCRLKSYVIPGDEVIVSRTYGEYACGWFQPAKGAETVGWIKSENLEMLETSRNPAEKDWLGDWRFYKNRIVIAKSKTTALLDITGDATWEGQAGNVHVGELDESAKPLEYLLKLGENDTEEYACKVSMWLLGKYLVVSDNLNCGGLNVTFSGVYQKKASK